MKLVLKKEVNVEDAHLEIDIDLSRPASEMVIRFSATCPSCAGYGCNNHKINNKDCVAGDLSKKVELSKLDTVFEREQIATIKEAIQWMYTSIFGIIK